MIPRYCGWETCRAAPSVLLHWAVYDSQINLPVIYMMELEDSGQVACPRTNAAGPKCRPI